MNNVDKKDIVRIFNEYKLVLETQMHFNEMLIRYRALAFTVVPALGGLAALLLEEFTEAQISGWFTFLLMGVWIAIFLVDYLYYFKMLLGAVDRGKEIEEEINKYDINPSFLGMTHKICKRISEPCSHLIVILFYAIPLVAGVVVTLLLWT